MKEGNGQNWWKHAFIGAIAVWAVEHIAGGLLTIPMLEREIKAVQEQHVEILKRLSICGEQK